MATNFVIESWTYLAIDIVVVFGRFFARWKSLGFRRLAVDDFLMVIALVRWSFRLLPPAIAYTSSITASVYSRDGHGALCWCILVWISEQRVCAIYFLKVHCYCRQANIYIE